MQLNFRAHIPTTKLSILHSWKGKGEKGGRGRENMHIREDVSDDNVYLCVGLCVVHTVYSSCMWLYVTIFVHLSICLPLTYPLIPLSIHLSIHHLSIFCLSIHYLHIHPSVCYYLSSQMSIHPSIHHPSIIYPSIS